MNKCHEECKAEGSRAAQAIRALAGEDPQAYQAWAEGFRDEFPDQFTGWQSNLRFYFRLLKNMFYTMNRNGQKTI